MMNREEFINKYSDEEYDRASNKYVKTSTLKSESWTTGGEWWSYTGARGYFNNEGEPSFTKFDELIEEVCPDITFIKYKKIYSKLVSIEDGKTRDYYENREYSYYVCDLDELFDMLVGMNLIETEE